MGRPGVTVWLRSVAVRAVLLALLWIAVTEADASPGYAPVAVAVATAVSLVVTGGPGSPAPGRASALRRTGRALALAGWVAGRSVVGGIDVARRALRLPRTDIDPVWTTYTCSLPGETSRIVFAFVLNLMPGTLSARLHGPGRDVLDVHVISRELDVESSAAELERRIAGLL
ncbi:Na+/H+ antiporter subunit E [Serinibacter arcticus]|uniref:Na+/H+ antiporter subunit E n=1 Tax=Serinibacter arcticus TaxID=1655435 RepID=UPI0013050577|nr:Na+/H+ antiporter subunit E [Serinibacter arcticus]